MRLADLLKRLHADTASTLTLQREPARPDPRICDFTEDSRTAMPGSLFVARPGFATDGRDFIQQAARDGAAAVLTDHHAAQRVPHHLGLITTTPRNLPAATAHLAEAFYHNPAQTLTITAITGTNGKTTTAHLLHQLLNLASIPTGLVGTVAIDDGRATTPADMTTPAASDLSHLLRAMLDNRRTHAVIEASSHALHQQRLAAITPNTDVAIFTNLSHDHLDYHHTIDNYAAAKAILFQTLPPSALAILTRDDPHTPRMLRDCTARHITTAPDDPQAELTIAATTDPSIATTDIRITARQRKTSPAPIQTTTTLIGQHNLRNLLNAAAAALHLGVSPAQLTAAIPNLTPPTGRLQRIQPAHSEANDLAVFIDFAHTPDALHHALAALQRAKPNHAKLVVVFGAGGDRDPDKRPTMGKTAAELADNVVVTSDNPRSEHPSAIITDILNGMTPAQRQAAHVHADRASAIRHAITSAAPGDTVLIAGKGHEQHQITAERHTGAILRTPFSDHQHAHAALELRLTAQTRDHQQQPRHKHEPSPATASHSTAAHRP